MNIWDLFPFMVEMNLLSKNQFITPIDQNSCQSELYFSSLPYQKTITNPFQIIQKYLI